MKSLCDDYGATELSIHEDMFHIQTTKQLVEKRVEEAHWRACVIPIKLYKGERIVAVVPET